MYDLKNWNLRASPSALPTFTHGMLNLRLAEQSGCVLRQNRTIEESAYSTDAVYTIQDGRAKGTMFKLHFTEYDNHSDIPSWGGGYGNIFGMSVT